MKKVIRMAVKTLWHSCQDELPPNPINCTSVKRYLVVDSDGTVGMALWLKNQWDHITVNVRPDDIVGWAAPPKPYFEELV